MPPPEYVDIDGVILNGTYGALPWWCDFDLSPAPIWGNRTTKGDPAIPIPHADGDLPAEVNLSGLGCTLLGLVYGEYDQDGEPVDGEGPQRMQLADNLEVLADLVGGGQRTFTYVLYERSYETGVTVLDMQGGTSGPLQLADVPPTAQTVALKLYVAAGVLALAGS